jgi:hypothetical protein
LLVLIQGLLPAAIVYLTRPLIDSLVATVNSGPGDSINALKPVLWWGGLMAAVMLLAELLRGLIAWIRWNQSELLRDHIAGLINRHSNLDWRRVYDLAARHRCERVLFLGLRLASAVAGISTPPEMDRLMEGDRESARLAAKVIQRLLSDSNSKLSQSAESLFIFRLQRLWLDKIRSFARIATTPSAADWLSFPTFGGPPGRILCCARYG